LGVYFELLDFPERVGVAGDARLLAVEADDDGLSHLPLRPEMSINRSGRWRISYRPKLGFSLSGTGLTPVEELKTNLIAVIADSAESQSQDQEG
jgi:hypothetical protein